MAYSLVPNSWEPSPEQKKAVYASRALTQTVNKHLGSGIVPSRGKAAPTVVHTDPFNPEFRSVSLRDWQDEDISSGRSFILGNGTGDIDIDGRLPDAADNRTYAQMVLFSLGHFGVDTRMQFGRASNGFATHLLVNLDAEEAELVGALLPHWPKAMNFDQEGSVNTEFRYHIADKKKGANNKSVLSTHTCAPGVVYFGDDAADGVADPIVWYVDGQPVYDLSALMQRTPRCTKLLSAAKAVAFGGILFLIRNEWTEGSRHDWVNTFSGWLARRAISGHRMNGNGIYSHLASLNDATDMLRLACRWFKDEEEESRVSQLISAHKKLEANPDAKIPGEVKMRAELGAMFSTHADGLLTPAVSSHVKDIEDMVNGYVYSMSQSLYANISLMRKRMPYLKTGAEMAEAFKHVKVQLPNHKKEMSLFHLVDESPARPVVDTIGMYPEAAPLSKVRVAHGGRALSDNDETEHEFLALNSWPGFYYKPVDKPLPDVMAQCEADIRWLLSLLTQNDERDIEYILKWVAAIVQEPWRKYTSALIFIGGMGTGKSTFGGVFLNRLFRGMFCNLNLKAFDSRFAIPQMENSLVAFGDEAHNMKQSACDLLKMAIRGTEIPGEDKGASSRTYHIPARLVFASNNEVRLSDDDVVDRALYYLRAEDRFSKGMDQITFAEWTKTLKLQFTQFYERLESPVVMGHYMRMFHDIKYTGYEIEDIKFAESNIFPSFMTRAIIKFVENEGMSRPVRLKEHEIWSKNAISDDCFSAAFDGTFDNVGIFKVLRIKHLSTEAVLDEMRALNLIERVPGGHRFAHKWGTTIDILQRTTNIKIIPHREPGADEYD